MTNPIEGKYNNLKADIAYNGRMVIPIQEKAKNILFLFSKDLK
jgi:hypothetical protein